MTEKPGRSRSSNKTQASRADNRAGDFCLPIGLSVFENGLGLLCHTAAVILEYSLGLLHIVYGDRAEMDGGLLCPARGIDHHAADQHMVTDGRNGALAAAIDKAGRGEGSIILLPPAGMWFIIHISKTLYRDEVVR